MNDTKHHTPRTDKHMEYREDFENCDPDFARKLETELQEMTTLADRLAETLSELMAMRHKCFIPNEGDWWDNKASAALTAYENHKKQTP